MKIYVAGSSKETSIMRGWMGHLRNFGHEITYDWTNDVDQGIQNENCAVTDVSAVLDAEVVLARISPLHTQRGTWLEMGVAIGQGIPVLVIEDDMYRNVFKHHPLIHSLGLFVSINTVIVKLNELFPGRGGKCHTCDDTGIVGEHDNPDDCPRCVG